MSDGPPHEALPGTTYKGFSVPPCGAAAAPRARRAAGRARPRTLAAGLAGLLVLGALVGYGWQARSRLAASPPPPASAAPPAIGPLGDLPLAPRHAAAPAPPALAAQVPLRTERPPQALARRTSGADRPAFHCDWRLRPSERMVCADPRLARLDRRLNHSFAAAVRAGVPRARLRADQDAWVMRREAVARRSRAALANYYSRRIAALDALARRSKRQRRG